MREVSSTGILAERIKGLIGIRNTLRDLIEIQSGNVTDEEVQPYIEKLKKE